MAGKQEQEHLYGAPLQVSEACARTLLTCQAPGHSVDTLQDHPLASLMAHTPLESGAPDAAVRGWNDCMAFLHAYHDEQLHHRLSPRDAIQAMLFDVMEYERCLSIGTEQYRGAQINIVCFKQSGSAAGGMQGIQGQLVTQMAVMTRNALARQPLHTTTSITQHPALQRLSETLTQLQVGLRDSKNDQSAFAHLALSVLALLDAEYDMEAGKVQTGATGTDSEDQPSDGASLQSSAEQSDGQNSEGVAENAEDAPSLVITIENNGLAESDDRHAVDDAASVSSAGGDVGQQVQAYDSYRAYSTQQDEIVDAADLDLTQDISTYRKQLDLFIGKHGAIVNRLSARLRQLLLAQQRSSWAFDQEEGLLDTSRLYRVVTMPSYPLTFKVERQSLFKDTTVTLLIDNSKSMVGKPIATAAACADILAQTLERCGVSVEILGFTTTQLHGSDLLARWQGDGANFSPGRMNGLRHIIYKSAATPYRRASVNLGAMLDRQLLKQNIDGEALQWAYERLRLRPNARKILMVISDGAPLDASTLTANPKDYLVAHLHQSIAKVEGDKQVEICAIGINHDVSHYYSNAISIHDARDLGKALLAQLSGLFKR